MKTNVDDGLIVALIVVAAILAGLYLLLVHLGAPKWVALTIVLVICAMPGSCQGSADDE